MERGSVDQRRAAMPVVSAWVDELRAMLGAEMINRQIAVGMQAQREYAQVELAQGVEAAEAWRRVNAHRCTFFAEEGGRRVGLASPLGAGVLPVIDFRVAAAVAGADGAVGVQASSGRS